MVIKREITFSEGRSCFLFGPRQSGKTTLVKSCLAPSDLYFNLLPETSFLSYAKEPGRFRAEVLSHAKRHKRFRCVIDEVQKLPSLLDEVHDLIETTDIRFTLTGSSARKLKRSGGNLLAGRASVLSCFPLIWREIGSRFVLERALRFGQLPPLWSGEHAHGDAEAFFQAYTTTYMKEEILQEGLIRRLVPFARFLDVAAENDAQIVNFSTVARDCGVSVKTVQQYYEILEDTFLSSRLESWQKSTRKRLVAAPKYYFFDAGVTNALTNRLSAQLSSEEKGRRFEAWLYNQMRAVIAYQKLPLQVFFWRTYSGQEVDFVLVRHGVPIAAIEAKTGNRHGRQDVNGLRAFLEDYPEVPAFIVTNERASADGGEARRRELDNEISVEPWRIFLEETFQKLVQ